MCFSTLSWDCFLVPFRSLQTFILELSPTRGCIFRIFTCPETYAPKKREAPFCYFLQSFRLSLRRLSASFWVLECVPTSSFRVSLGPSASLCVVFPRLSVSFRVALRRLSSSLCVLPCRSASSCRVFLCISASLCVVFPRRSALSPPLCGFSRLCLSYLIFATFSSSIFNRFGLTVGSLLAPF